MLCLNATNVEFQLKIYIENWTMTHKIKIKEKSGQIMLIGKVRIRMRMQQTTYKTFWAISVPESLGNIVYIDRSYYYNLHERDNSL